MLEDQVQRARQNLAAAGLAGCVEVSCCNVLDLVAPAEAGVMVANPPYGVRIGEAEALAELYPLLGDALKKNWIGWRCYFFSAATPCCRA